jgi:hypothetical protein
MNKQVPNTQRTSIRKSRGLWWKLPIALVILLALFVVLLPTFVGWGLGHGVISSAIEDRVNGSVTLTDVEASWLGEQTVRGLTITTADGVKAADLTATLHASLLDILLGKVETYDLDIAGELNGALRSDGTLSFAELLKRAPSRAAAPTPKPSSRAAIPGAAVTLAPLVITLHNEARNETIRLEDVTGELVLKPGQAARASLEGTSIARGESGTFKLMATADGAIDATGAFTPAGASASLTVLLVRVPVVFSESEAIVHALDVQASSDDLARRIELTMNGKAQMQGADPSSISGAFSVNDPFNAAGEMTLAIDAITGSVTGTRVPSALLQPFIAAGSPLRLERDLGPTVDVSATFSEGESKQIELLASGEAVRLELTGTIDTIDKSFLADRLVLEARVDPELAQALANVEIDRAGRARAEFTRVSVPSQGGDNGFDFGAVGLTGTVTVEESLAVTLPGEEPRTFQVRGAVVHIESESLGTLVHATGSASVDELSLEFDESVANLIGADGSIAFDQLVPEGFVRVAGITDATVQTFTPGVADLIIVNKLLPATAELRTQATDGGWSAELAIAGNKLAALATAQRTGDLVTAQVADLDMRVSPALVAHLQSESESPIVLLGPAQLKLVGEPIEIPADELATFDLASRPIRMHGTFAEATFDNLPALDEPVLVTGFEAQLALRSKPERAYAADGMATLALAADGFKLSEVRFDVSLAEVDGRMSPKGTIALRELSVQAVERATDREAGSFSSFVGATGDMRVTLEREGDVYHSNIEADLANLTGTFVASLSSELLTLSAETSKFVLDKDALNRFLAKAAPPGDAATQDSLFPEVLTARTDLPLDAQVRKLQIPVGALKHDAFDSALVEIDIALTGGPVTLVEPTLGTLTSQSIAASIRSQDLALGVQFGVNVTAETTESSASVITETGPTQIRIDGALTNLLDSESRLSTATATLDMKAEATRIPTAVVDAVASFNGLLVAALGPQVQAAATAEDFSLNTGKLTSRLEANHGWMEGIVKGREGVLQLSQTNPLRAELQITPSLRERLLYKIHPILADIRTTEQPLRVLVPNASMPVGGDVSKLNARIEITIGAVELDGGSTSLFLLKLFDTERGTTIPGSIEPIVATITDGVLTYQKFTVHIDKYRMNYSGTIDLNTGTVNLRTELPLDALATSIAELRGYAENITVPIVTHGTFGNLKTQIDPSFDIAREALKGGLRGTLGDILNRDRNKSPDEKPNGATEDEPKDQVMDILDTILRGVGKTKENQDGQQGNASPRRRQ